MVKIIFDISLITDNIITQQIKTLEQYQNDSLSDEFTTIIFIHYGIHDLPIIKTLQKYKNAKGFFIYMRTDEDGRQVDTIRRHLQPNIVFSLKYDDDDLKKKFTNLLAPCFENYILQPLANEGKFKDEREGKEEYNFRFQ